MKYKENWHKSRERFNALWERELIDRCCVSVRAPKKNANCRFDPYPSNEEEITKYWTDGEIIAKRFREEFENTYYGGDAFPCIPIKLGAAGCAGFFKNTIFKFGQNTVWFFPFIKDYLEDDILFDQESLLYKKTYEIAHYLSKESEGDYIIGMPDLSGTSDALAHMRGSENLLMDMLDEPDRVKKALGIIQEVRLKTSQDVYKIIKDSNYGGCSIGWLNTWGKGWHDQMQCDLAAMISTDTYKEFIMPELEEQTRYMDIPLYHFDGIEQIRHLDMLLSLDKLAAIQWTSVAGQPSILEYMHIFKKIQAAGKVLLLGVQPNQIDTVMEQLSSKGLYLLVQSSSEEEAKEIEKKIGRMTHE